MPPVYLLEADQTPQPMVLASLPDPNAIAPANPLTHTQYSPAILSHYPLNQDSRRNELTAILGGGAVAVGQGLDLSDGGGLTLSISAGAHNNGGWIYQSTAKTLALPDNVYDAGDLEVRLHIWLSRTGDPSCRTDLTQPSSPSVYLGSARTDSGAIVDIDYSGRVELNAIPYRRTADAGEPNDTLPANWRGLARTDGGLYWWDGAAYIPSMDAQTVLVSLSHTTAGALDDVVIGGDGITVAVVDTGGGVYALRISFDAETATGIPVVHTDVPPTFTVQVQRGGEALFYVSWAARGSFQSDSSVDQPLYTAHPVFGPALTNPDPAVLGPLELSEVVGSCYANANSADAGPAFERDGTGTILRVRDFSPALSLATQNELVDVEISLELVGLGWVDGAEPEDGECVVTEFYSAGPGKLEFTKVVTITPGETTRYKCDFHLRGYFTDDFSARITPDQAGIACLVHDSFRMVQGDDADPEVLSASFYFDLQAALDTVSGDYGDETQVKLRFVITGPGYREVNPAGAISVTPDTYDYGAFATEDYVDAAIAAASSSLDHPIASFGLNNIDATTGYTASDQNCWDGAGWDGDVAELLVGSGRVTTLAVRLNQAIPVGGGLSVRVYLNGTGTGATLNMVAGEQEKIVFFATSDAYTAGDKLDIRWSQSGLDPGTHGRVRVVG